jgi:hypothetical protein
MQVNGELRRWHKVTLDVEGPCAGETASTSRDHRPDVTLANARPGTNRTGTNRTGTNRTGTNRTGTGFDGTPGAHDDAPHAGAWRSGDTSRDGGSGIVGAADAPAS